MRYRIWGMVLLSITLLNGCTSTTNKTQQKLIRSTHAEQERVPAAARASEQQKTLPQRVTKKSAAPGVIHEPEEDAVSAPDSVPPGRISVTLEGGTAVVNGQRGSLDSVTFETGNGELRMVDVRIVSKANSYRSVLAVSYRDGLLRLDLPEVSVDANANRMDFSPAWFKGGASYQVSTEGPMSLRGVKVGVKAARQ